MAGPPGGAGTERAGGRAARAGSDDGGAARGTRAGPPGGAGTERARGLAARAGSDDGGAARGTRAGPPGGAGTVTYVPRTYPEIVRDMLTTLTGGVVREVLTVPAGSDPVLVLDRLADRPVRRVSHLQGRIKVGAALDAPEVDYRFTPADF